MRSHGLSTEVISEVTVVVETIEAHTHTCADEGEAQNPRGSIYTTIMELGPQNHNGDGL